MKGTLNILGATLTHVESSYSCPVLRATYCSHGSQQSGALSGMPSRLRGQAQAASVLSKRM